MVIDIEAHRNASGSFRSWSQTLSCHNLGLDRDCQCYEESLSDSASTLAIHCAKAPRADDDHSGYHGATQTARESLATSPASALADTKTQASHEGEAEHPASTPIPTGSSSSSPGHHAPDTSSTHRTVSLPLPPRLQQHAKRTRAAHDVDGPGTCAQPSKKRRIRLHLITSRLSQPYSQPATHIHRSSNSSSSSSGGHGHVEPRLFFVVCAGGAGGGGTGGAGTGGGANALMRKAAILNRLRIEVNNAARGDSAVRQDFVDRRGGAWVHGLQLATKPSSPSAATGTLVPAAPSPSPRLAPLQHSPLAGGEVRRDEGGGTAAGPERVAVERIEHHPATADEEDVAFPSAGWDLSDEDDVDHVYADFGALFGGGMRSPEAKAAGDEHFYGEYLDELDGIPWVV
ncbi:hypothetical protein F4780DRAFT_316561 [Xylariomycetidae sp. FL0641]|nr:hypothetical protein F4780DRAFT_316561 [Xylariomycetidae sp. FL0641]